MMKIVLFILSSVRLVHEISNALNRCDGYTILRNVPRDPLEVAKNKSGRTQYTDIE